MIGSRCETSRPILMVCCTDSTSRIDVERTIRNSRIPDIYPSFGLGASALPLENPGALRALGGSVLTESAASPHSPTESLWWVGRRIRIGAGCQVAPLDWRAPELSCLATGGVIFEMLSGYYQLTAFRIDETTAIPEPATSNLVDSTYMQEIMCLDECYFDDLTDDDEEEGDGREDQTSSIFPQEVEATSRGSVSSEGK